MKVRVLRAYQAARDKFGRKLMEKGTWLPPECWPPFEFDIIDIPVTNAEFDEMTRYEKATHLEPWVRSAAYRACEQALNW